MLNLSLQLAAVLDELPVAVALVSRKGRVVSKTGSKMGLVGEYVPSFDRRENLAAGASGMRVVPLFRRRIGRAAAPCVASAIMMAWSAPSSMARSRK